MYGGEPRIAPDCVRLRSPSIRVGQAEVGDVGLAAGIEQDVRGLQVAVQHARWWAWCTARATVAISSGSGPGVGGVLLQPLPPALPPSTSFIAK